MENGFSTSDALLTQAMSAFGGGRGGGGGNWGGGNYYGRPFADDASNAVRINRNQQASENDNDCTRSVLGLGLDSIRDAFEGAERTRQFNDVKDNQFRAELRTNDQIAAVRAQAVADAAAAAACCCELKLENCKNTAALTAEIKAVEARTIARELDKAEREIIFLRSNKHHS